MGNFLDFHETGRKKCQKSGRFSRKWGQNQSKVGPQWQYSGDAVERWPRTHTTGYPPGPHHVPYPLPPGTTPTPPHRLVYSYRSVTQPGTVHQASFGYSQRVKRGKCSKPPLFRTTFRTTFGHVKTAFFVKTDRERGWISAKTSKITKITKIMENGHFSDTSGFSLFLVVFHCS